HTQNDSPASFAKTTLDNGVRVISERIPSVRSVSVGIWILAGSRDEEVHQAGISHFIEHMVFKGTKKRRMHHIAQRMEAVGGYLNAFTSKEYTCYFARALDEHLERAVDTLCDLVLSPNFPEKEISKEKDVVLEEMKMYEDSPEDLIFDRFESVVYEDHELGRPVIGYPETVMSLDREQLRSYVDRTYAPDRIVLAAAGNVDHDQVVRFARTSLAELSRATRAPIRTPLNGYSARSVEEYRPIQQAHAALGTRGLDVHDEDRVALTVLNTILGGGMSSRLNQNIREKYGFCYNVYSFMNMHSDSGDFGVYIGTDVQKVDRAMQLIMRELQKLVDVPVSSRMMNQAKNQVRGSVMLGLESMSNRMMRIGRQELYFERYISLDEINADVEAVSADDVQRVAEKMFEEGRFSSVILLPTA
ncbi:MAG: pitrilysin family protein, partial [Rhodothermales bacterium]